MKEAERILLEKVGDVIRSVDHGSDELISALHSLASILFTINDHIPQDEVGDVKVLCLENRKMFYGGAAFPTLARFLLYDVASDWLPCFPISATKSVYDVFFVNAPIIQVVEILLPCLHQTNNQTTSVCENAERLLVLCLLDNNGLVHIIRDFSTSVQFEGLTIDHLKQSVSHVAQLITSVPDKARQRAPTSLSAHIFFKQITTQLLDGVDDTFFEGNKSNMDVAVVFIAELISRICRRGSTDVLLTEIVPRILKQVSILVSEASDMDSEEQFGSTAAISFWSKIMQSIKDPYSVERMSEQLLHYLAAQSATDAEAYWVMRVLYHHVYIHQPSIRSMFTEKFLLWKVFPVRCLNWIIHFAIMEQMPGTYLKKGDYETRVLLETVQRAASAWSKQEFVQSAPVEQQVYVTAALGLCLEKMSKKDLDAAKDALPSILKGVSCRLESADYMVRKMASNIALVFSKVIDPQNPLYLDDSSHEDPIDWEFGLADKERKSIVASASHSSAGNKSEPMMNEIKHTNDRLISSRVKMREKKSSELRIIDPDEIVDPADLSANLWSDGDQDYSSGEESDTSSDSSLQPYDLSDDGADLKKKFTQIVDVVAALRKPDDADAVEGALGVIEGLIRASPDELRHIASELVRTLINVRCSDVTIEGEEESAEEKRQKALVALVVTCPIESLDTLNKLLYASNLDVSQRIMILDIMTDAAEELACSKVPNRGSRPATLISSVSDQPWFIPRNIGPPGSSSWKELSSPGTVLNWSHSYERELPSKPSQAKQGKTRRWSLKSTTQDNHLDLSQNKFPQYAAAFMLPAMQGFDKRRHGVDLLGRDFIVLGKLIYMLGICMKCAAMHPEASVLASSLLDMFSSRAISLHKEAYVRRAVLFAASCTLVALQPSYVASALSEGNSGICNGLEWIRTFALQVAEADVDRDCYTMAMNCLQLHSEMALQVSRALESTQNKFGTKAVSLLPSSLTKGTIRIPH